MTDMDKLMQDYEEARDEVITVRKSIKWAVAFEMDEETMSELQERYDYAIVVFDQVCNQLIEAGIPAYKLILMEMGE